MTTPTGPKRLCGAKNRAGGTCRQRAMPNGRCRYHGGLSLVGPASPTFKHGRYSKLLPGGLAQHYVRAEKDPQLLGLRDEIALTDARIGALLDQVSRSRSQRLTATVSRQLDTLIETRRKLIATETTRLKDLQQMISLQQAMTLVAQLAHVVREHVTDRQVLAAISAGLLRLVGPGARDAAAPGGPGPDTIDTRAVAAALDRSDP